METVTNKSVRQPQHDGPRARPQNEHPDPRNGAQGTTQRAWRRVEQVAQVPAQQCSDNVQEINLGQMRDPQGILEQPTIRDDTTNTLEHNPRPAEIILEPQNVPVHSAAAPQQNCQHAATSNSPILSTPEGQQSEGPAPPNPTPVNADFAQEKQPNCGPNSAQIAEGSIVADAVQKFPATTEQGLNLNQPPKNNAPLQELDSNPFFALNGVLEESTNCALNREESFATSEFGSQQELNAIVEVDNGNSVDGSGQGGICEEVASDVQSPREPKSSSVDSLVRSPKGGAKHTSNEVQKAKQHIMDKHGVSPTKIPPPPARVTRSKTLAQPQASKGNKKSRKNSQPSASLF